MSDIAPLGNGNGANNANSTEIVPRALDGEVMPRTSGVGTDFLMFGVGGGANVEAQIDYQNDAQRPTGNLPGIARSNFNNKAIRQGTFVAHSLSLWTSQQINEYIADDGNDIAWIGSFSSALSAFMLTLIPEGPNLGLYLPIAGGTMAGNINFQSGISTVLANNTWYFARDTGGTSRGLIIKGNDNNVWINDGSSTYVRINGIPIVNNNISWAGRDTGAVARNIIGMLSDNSTHVMSPAPAGGHIYLDCSGGGSVWASSNIVVNNNSYYFGKDTGGSARTLLGLNAANALLIGSGVTASTDIYAGSGQTIYLHNNTNSLGILTVNQYSYLNGGGRAYIPGGNDPWQVYSDHGFYARINYTVGGTRSWTSGVGASGTFMTADETAQAVRFEIALNGQGHFYAGLDVDGAMIADSLTASGTLNISGAGMINNGLTVFNALNVASGNLTVNARGIFGTGITVSGGLFISSGDLQVTGGAGINNGLTVYNNFNMASGTMWVNGPLNAYSNAYVAGSVQIGGLSPLYDSGSNNLTTAGNFYVYQGTITTAWLNVLSNGNLGSLTVSSTATINGNTVVNGSFTAQGAASLRGGAVAGHTGANVYAALTIQGAAGTPVALLYSQGAGNGTAANAAWWVGLQGDGTWTVSPSPGVSSIYISIPGVVTVGNSFRCGPGVYNTDYTHSVPNGDGVWYSGMTGSAWAWMVAYNHGPPSDPRFKRDIEPVAPGCLDMVRRIEPKTYKLVNANEGTAEEVHWGFMAPEVAQVMADAGRQFSGVRDEASGSMLSTNQMLAVLWSAVRELSEALEARKEEEIAA